MEMIVKQFEGFSLRHNLDENGDVWFVAKDVMDILGIKSQAHALRKLDDDQRGEVELQGEGGFRKLSTVSESGLYDLVMQSSKPSARPFQRWVTKEVLPSIRKTGSYSIQTEDPRLTQMKAAVKMIEHIIEQEKINQELKTENAVLKDRVGSVENNVGYVEKTVGQLMRHRKGNDPIPSGMITLKRLRAKYFNGVSEPIISSFLRIINHRTEPYTYVANGSEIPSFCYEEEGIPEKSRSFFNAIELVNDMAKNIRVQHPLIEGAFWLNKDTTPIHIQEMVLKQKNPLTLLTSET